MFTKKRWYMLYWNLKKKKINWLFWTKKDKLHKNNDILVNTQFKKSNQSTYFLINNLQTPTAISSFPWGIRYTQQQPAEQILLLQQPRHQQNKQQRMNQTRRKTMCSQIITNSWHFIQWGFSTFFFRATCKLIYIG